MTAQKPFLRPAPLVVAALIGLCPAVASTADTPEHADIRALIADARASGVPEEYAPAEGLIAERLAERPDDPALLTLRATVRQATHAFGPALADLDRVLTLRAQDPQARLTRAFLRATVGDTAGAAEDCKALPMHAGRLIRAACAARVLDVSGRPAEAAALLDRAIAGTPPELRVWVHELMAAFSDRAGDLVVAERHYAAIASLMPHEERHAVAHAGFLRRTGRPEQALGRLPVAETDAGLLERALSLRAAGRPDGAEIVELERRIAADLAEGHEGHLRESARFHLDILGDAEVAHRIAQRNWQLQKEPEDRALLLEAADARRAARSLPAD